MFRFLKSSSVHSRVEAPPFVELNDKQSSQKTKFANNSLSSLVSVCESDQYDFCLVFPTEKKANGEWDVTDRGRGYLEKLEDLGFEIYAFRVIGDAPTTLCSFFQCFRSKQQTATTSSEGTYCLIYVLIRAPIHKLREYAERIDMKMLLDPKIAEELLAKGDAEHGIAGCKIRHEPNITLLTPFEYIYGKYRQNREHLFWKPFKQLHSAKQEDERLLTHGDSDESHPFRDLLRIKLSAIILQSRPRYLKEDGERYSAQNLKIARYVKYQWLLGCYLLHKQANNAFFREQWSKYPFQPQPIEEIKEYFGEKVALYHLFMGHYTTFLWIIAIIAVPFQIMVWYLNDYSASFIPIYALVLPIWSVIKLELWKRTEKYTALKWGMINFRRDEYDRPEFKGEEMDSHIHGGKQVYFSSRERNTRVTVSALATALICVVVVGSVASIYLMRIAVSPTIGDSDAQSLASITEALSEWENYRTDTAFEDSMITKIFIYQFINSYASFFYLAFIAQYVGDCPADVGCMPSLAYNLGIIFASRYIVGTLITRLLIPYLRIQSKKRDYLRRMCHFPIARKQLTNPEIEFLKHKVDIQKYFFDVYADAALQMGYTALFASALPLAAFFSLVLNILKIRSEPWIWFELCQLPLPRGAETIGSWRTIMEILTRLSIITNAALIVFTMTNLLKYSLIFRFWVFILFQWTSFIFQGLTKYLLIDETETIRVQQEREKFIVSKLIHKQPDDHAGYEPRRPFVPVRYQPIPQQQSLIVFR